MPQPDAVLLDKWRAQSDADAFAELISRHASMVYGACLRVVRNPGIAEEVAQECFLELMKGPRGIQCIGAWLHTVATRRALDRVKSEGRRAEREKHYAASLDTAAEVSWDDTREYVDEAIAALPDELRVPIILRFLEGNTHEAIAEELALSRSTVRSRIEKGIGVVRENLVKRGVVLSMAALSTGLEGMEAVAAPPALLAELGKRALAVRSAPTLLSATAGAKFAAAPLLLAGVVLAGAWAATRNTKPPENNVEPTVVAAAVTPEPTAPPEVPAVVVESPLPVEATVENTDVTTETPSSIAEEEQGWKLDLTPSETLREALQAKADIEFEEIHIKDVAEFLQDSFEINLVLDQRVVAPELEEHVENEAVGAPPGLQPGLPPGFQPGLRSGASVPGPPPAPVQFVRLPRAYLTDGHIRAIDQKDKTLEEILTTITSPLNLIWRIRGNAVWISSSAQLTEDMTVPLPSAPFKEGEVFTTLSSPVNIEFEDIHVTELVGFVQTAFKVNISLDTAVIMPETKTGDSAPPDPSQFATDGRLDYINLKDASMAETLFVMTRMLNLSYRVGKDGIFISTPDRLKGSF
ncbi:MAG: sigma-70 family RNA polymerase sigma factor [Candidatus Hydrogenedentes bacterium]|nr:sigma-70 family RNA polymerase sigma factor [Candidatus Hydrogenedentota bacterium]